MEWSEKELVKLIRRETTQKGDFVLPFFSGYGVAPGGSVVLVTTLSGEDFERCRLRKIIIPRSCGIFFSVMFYYKGKPIAPSMPAELFSENIKPITIRQEVIDNPREFQIEIHNISGGSLSFFGVAVCDLL